MLSIHSIPIYEVGCICQNLHAFWGDQIVPKPACRGLNSILRTGALDLGLLKIASLDGVTMSDLQLRENFHKKIRDPVTPVPETSFGPPTADLGPFGSHEKTCKF